MPDPAEELIQSYFVKPEGSNHGLFMTATEILEFCSPASNLQIKPQQIGVAMKKLGYTPRKSHGVRGFCVEKLDGERRVSNQKIMAMDVSEP